MKTRFETYSDIELLEIFNKEVGNKGWTSSRAEFLSELHTEFDNKGFNYSKIGDTKSISFKNKIRLDGNKIEIL